jgi:NADPH:quinone reductase
MRAIEIISSGPDYPLKLVDLPAPAPASDQVLIRVAAAGVNRPDLLQRRGLYPPPHGASEILGLEIAGTIETMGSNVANLQRGDAVCALVSGGGYAEYCLADAACCLPIPQGLTLIEAAALPETYFTVWSNLFNRARLTPGESLLVHGGGSGIGTTAIQLAKSLGNRVFVTAGNEHKCCRCLSLNADAAINYNAQDFVGVIQELTDGKGVDVILDIIGGDYFPRNLSCLATEGRLVQIAVQHGARSEINLWPLLQKRLTVTGSTLRSRDSGFKGEIARQLQHSVWPLLESGAIRPIIDTVFPLAEAEHAHQRMISNQHFGKLVLEI